uniref:Uncharacterized protein n=1 Tax=Cacopsylla melanoneura TaxID=428564 RepID=A0A8D8XPT7_9HEMI
MMHNQQAVPMMLKAVMVLQPQKPPVDMMEVNNPVVPKANSNLTMAQSQKRRDSLDNLSGGGGDNTYATIQGGAGDYATLGGSIIPLDNVSSHSQQMYEASLGFQGSTFQVPKSNEILRKAPPLPATPSEGDKDSHQPEFILELL